jgi:hypothetical protein
LASTRSVTDLPTPGSPVTRAKPPSRIENVLVRALAVDRTEVSTVAWPTAAFGVLMCLELAVSVFVFKKPPSEFLLEYGTVSGMIGLAAQLAYATFPLIQARRSGRSAAIPRA